MDDKLLFLIAALFAGVAVLLIFLLQIRYQKRLSALDKNFHATEKELESQKVEAEKNMLIWIAISQYQVIGF